MGKPSSNNDHLGGRNDDVINSDGNSTFLKGGRGDDTYYIDHEGVYVEEKNNGGNDTVVSSVDYTLDSEVENLVLAGIDGISGTGNELDNQLTGNDGDNSIFGGDGNDSIFGGAGDDYLSGNGGSDEIDGGDGYDTVSFDGPVADYSFNIEGAYVFVTSSDGEQDRIINVDSLVFSDATVLVLELEEVPSEDPPSDPDAPIALDDFGSVSQGGQIVLAILANDVGEGLSLVSADSGINGAVTVNDDGTITYQPFDGVSGSDTFNYTVIDSLGRTATADVTIEIVASNSAPVAEDDSFAATSGVTFQSNMSVFSNDLDPDGDPIYLASFDEASAGGGTVHVNDDGTFSYTSADSFSGPDTFQYSIADDSGELSTATVIIDVAGGGEGPTEVPYYVSGLIRGEDYRFNPNDPVGTEVIVTYAFAETTPDYYHETHFAWTDFESFTEDMQAITREALGDISEFANITFVETSVEEAAMLFGVADIGGGARGLAYYPGEYNVDTAKADVWIDSSLSGLSFEPGTEEYKTLTHEIGHALGLSHADLPLEEETRQYTVMSDRAHPDFDGEASSYLLYDVAAIQHLYGANNSDTAGDDVYTFDLFDESVRSVWDAGGHDTVDLSAATYGVQLDMRAGEFSSVSATGSNNISFAFGTEVEDAIGGMFDDVVQGNDADNNIDGGGGNDVMAGGEGFDVFSFGADSGADQVTDFSRGEDKIDLSEIASSMDDLTISLLEGAILVENEHGSIQLDGIEEVDENDFLFALV